MMNRPLLTAALSLASGCFAATAEASQFERFGDLDVHCIVADTTDLSPEMAERALWAC